MADVVMPRLSDSMEEGTVLAWMKSVGDEVAVGDELVEIETDKANMVYESDVAGTLTEILAEEGATLPIGEVIARVGGGAARPAPDGNGGRAAAEPGGESEPSGAEAPEAEPPAPVPQTERVPAERIKASPLARRMAGERGVDLAGLSGSGPGGRIVKSDVERAGEGATPGEPDVAAPRRLPLPGLAERPETARGGVEQVELTRLQQTVARRMAESKATAPHFYLTSEIDMSRAVEARARIKAATREGEIVPSFNDMIVKACALALREFPRANGAYRDGRVEEYSRVNIGIAVAAQDALVVPTVFDADTKGLREIAVESRAPRRAGSRGDDHAAGAVRRDLHGVEPGDVRSDELLGRDQPAAGGDPRRRLDRRGTGRPRRRDRRRAGGCRSTSPATTGSSTAPTERGSSPGCATYSRNRCSWHCEELDDRQRRDRRQRDGEAPDDRRAPGETAADRRARDPRRRAGRGHLGGHVPDHRACLQRTPRPACRRAARCRRHSRAGRSAPSRRNAAGLHRHPGDRAGDAGARRCAIASPSTPSSSGSTCCRDSARSCASRPARSSSAARAGSTGPA